MSIPATGSRRRAELLRRAYAYTVEHGLADLSLRPLASATATSPRVLLYLFGSKDELVKEILAHGRREQLTLMARLLESAPDGPDRFRWQVERLWRWLVDPAVRPAIGLFFEAYSLSLRAEPGPWHGFAQRSIEDWTTILVDAQPGVPTERAEDRAVGTLAMLRGLLLHLLAGGDADQLGRLLTTFLG